MNVEEKLCSKLFVKCELSGDFRTNEGERIECEITLAAYAKAEMAKRGWFIGYSTVDRDSSLCMRSVWGYSGLFSFDLADPLSEARAIIKACIKALEMEVDE